PERGRLRGEARPRIPHSERRLDVRVLDRPAVARTRCPDVVDTIVKSNVDGARVPVHGDDRGDERTDGQLVADAKRGRAGTMFGRRSVIAGPEHDRGERGDRVGSKRLAARKTDLHGLTGRYVNRGEAGGQRCRVIRNDQIARTDEARQIGRRMMREMSARVDHEQLRPACAVTRHDGGFHRSTSLIKRGPAPNPGSSLAGTPCPAPLLPPQRAKTARWGPRLAGALCAPKPIMRLETRTEFSFRAA